MSSPRRGWPDGPPSRSFRLRHRLGGSSLHRLRPRRLPIVDCQCEAFPCVPHEPSNGCIQGRRPTTAHNGQRTTHNKQAQLHKFVESRFIIGLEQDMQCSSGGYECDRLLGPEESAFLAISMITSPTKVMAHVLALGMRSTSPIIVPQGITITRISLVM
jgi:hypothetical protein